MFAHNTELSLVLLIMKYRDKIERERAIPLCLYFMNLTEEQHISLQPNTLHKYTSIQHASFQLTDGNLHNSRMAWMAWKPVETHQGMTPWWKSWIFEPWSNLLQPHPETSHQLWQLQSPPFLPVSAQTALALWWGTGNGTLHRTVNRLLV